MVSNLTILSETITFSILVSFFTTGISAASREGAVLYPFRLWLEKLSKKSYDALARLERYPNARRGRRQANYWIDPAIKLAKIRILKQTWWMKLLILCPQCMPTLWSIILYWTVFSHSPLYVWFLGWPIASTFNIIINKRWL